MTQQPHPLLPPQPYPQDRAVVQDAVVPTSLSRPRWSGRRTAAVGAIVLGLTTIGGIAAAAASPNGIAAPTQNGPGPGFGPGTGRGGFGPGAGRGGFGAGQFGPGQNPQQAPRGRVGRRAT